MWSVDTDTRFVEKREIHSNSFAQTATTSLIFFFVSRVLKDTEDCRDDGAIDWTIRRTTGRMI